MATPFDSSLFGGQALPAELQRQLDEKQAMEFAQLTPSQQLGNLGFSAGRAIGRGLGGVFGVDVQDPTVRQATMIRQLSQGLDLKTPDGLNSYADRLLANNLPAQAAQIAQMARDAAKTEAETTLKGAQAKRAENFQQANTVSERNRAVIREAEVKLAEDPNAKLSSREEADLRWLIGQETKPQTKYDTETGQLMVINPIDLEQTAPNIAKYLGKGSTTAGNVKVTSTQVGVPKLGEGIQKEIANTDESIVKVGTAEAKIKTLAPSIDNINLGLIANYEREGNAWLGLETPDAKEFKKLRRAVAEQANNLLLLAKGTQTEGDAQRARDQIVDDNTWKNKDLLKSAFDDLQTTLKDTQGALRVKRESLTSKGRAPAPANPADNVVAPKKSSMSGLNPQLQPTQENPAPQQGMPIPQEILDKANDAIKRGAKKEAVLKRLKDQGYAVQ